MNEERLPYEAPSVEEVAGGGDAAEIAPGTQRLVNE
jgi:hypothetical protein